MENQEFVTLNDPVGPVDQSGPAVIAILIMAGAVGSVIWLVSSLFG